MVSDPVRRRLMLIAVLAIIGAALLGMWWLTRGASPEKRYLDAVHNPCDHREVFPTLNHCAFTWEGDDESLVVEGYQICTAEKSRSMATGDTKDEGGTAYLRGLHPAYGPVQINTQIEASERFLCRG